MPKPLSVPHGAPSTYLLKFAAALIASTAVIALTFYFLYTKQLTESVNNTKLIAEIVIGHSDTDIQPNMAEIERKAASLLQLRQIDAVSLIDASGEVILQKGTPIDLEILSQVRAGARSVKHGNYLVYVYTLAGLELGNVNLLVEIDMSSQSLARLQFLAICALVLVGIFFVTQYLKRCLTKDILDPLDQLNDKLSKNNRQRVMVPFKPEDFGIYEELIQLLNEAVEIQTGKFNEYRKNSDSATQELRESLETVEIQNIDLDIARKNAVELNKLKSEFLKKTSQDLLTPLRGILSFSDLIKNYPLNTDQKEFLSTIQDSTQGMLAIVNDISDFSKLESGKLQIEQKPIDLRSCIESSLNLQTPTAITAGVELHSNFDPKLPSKVLGDSLRIQQIVSNLVANAVKFENANYVQIRVELIDTSDNDVDIAIRIQTDGLCPKELELWQEDQDLIKSDLNRAFYSRAGMGLIVAKGLSQHMRGNVFFESNEDLRVFSLEIKCSPSHDNRNDARAINSAYKVNAVVFSNSHRGYREIASRLSELYIKNHRATSFDEIISTAQRLKDNRQKHARYLPLAIIEAQTSDQTLDKIVLRQTLETLTKELNIPTLVLAPMGRYDTLQKVLAGINLEIFQRPIVSARFQKYILELLGIVKLKTEVNSETSNNGLKPIQILVVDDNLANIKLSKALLADFNVKATTACTGGEAILLAKQERFDLIFMDIELPDLSGYEVTKMIRQSEAQDIRTPIVALTAHDVVEEKRNILLAGMDDVIGKPLTTKDISIILDRWAISPHLKANLVDALPLTQTQSVTSTDQDEYIASPVSIADCLNLSKGSPDLAKDMLKMLLDTLPDEKLKISQCAMQSDLDELYEVVHKLYGACCYCGVPRLRKISKTLDRQLKDKDSDNLITNLEELHEAIDELSVWYESHDIDALFD